MPTMLFKKKKKTQKNQPVSNQSHCCYCSMQCSLQLVPSDKHESGLVVKPSPDFPVATGRLCQKGLNSLDHVVHPSRIKEPLVRVDQDRNNKWSNTSWNTAFDQISDKIKELQTTYGKDAVSVFGGGSLTNEVSYLLGKFTRVALQSKYIDYNGRYCMSSAAAAGNKAFGVDRGLTLPLSELENAKYIILAGTNIAECQPTMMPYLMAAKKKGAVIVTIDPRNTKTSKLADIHVRLQPGFDAMFVNSLLNVIVNEKLYDEKFIKDRTNGFSELVETVQPFTPDYVEEMTGILAPKIRTIARGFAKAKTGIVFTARGLEQQVNGVENTLNYINLCLTTGKIGKPGSGFGAVTGQANGQGGREHGQKADQLPGYRMLENESARAHVSKVWGISPDELPKSGVSAFELFEKINAGDIKAMIVLGSNPIVSSPNNAVVEQAFKKLELLVVVDLFETETAEYADWLLPGSSFLEAEGTLTNLEGRVFHRGKVLDTPNENLLDYEIICELAERLGRGQYFQYESIEDVFNELAKASAGGKADYSGITYKRLKEEKGLFWPCPDPEHPGTPKMFTKEFYHEDGKAKIFAIKPEKPAEPIDSEYPYILTTGRLGNHYLSGAQTRRTENLNKKSPIPVAEIHPWLAKKVGLIPNQKMKITSRRGSLEFHVKITEGIQPKTIFVPFHWGKELAINQLTNDALAPISRMPEFKICAVKVKAIK
ncbi:molybdopterin oxidoreductase family protein [Chengkuizengella axinellae]|uniref:Molybdopterin oxidoreductase family protein n=1 Tax=Chengkuizengella axinellae TaxID=3064388 RepID=A0ABT9J096_9BACL|nr:molybdopterin oxidoreductase family protein [Chengkuizengella sp. 2205SS18-9]MDP5275041.1 molybdopterin oxidoreductase family protein [Chengkuizengella sp. 2205SS18-9]